ncbi:MAG: Hsp20/alpha crystallin family protein [Thermoproteota archaeon]|nr:Hsp20/alpha crystallin family protein [Thermoproteota archaeon]
MDSWYPDRDEWFRRFFGRGERVGRGSFFDEMMREFEEMRRDMERMYENELKNMETKIPKELVREYTAPDGAKVRRVGPIVYGYSMTIGPDGRPHIKEFGNIKPSGLGGTPKMITSEREPLIDIAATDKEIKIVAEMPGVKKEDIKVNAYDSSVEIMTDDPQRKYHQVVDLPAETDIENVRSNYNNGILEITFGKKQQSKHHGKEIKVD